MTSEEKARIMHAVGSIASLDVDPHDITAAIGFLATDAERQDDHVKERFNLGCELRKEMDS